jgi:hypothetical protein
MAAPPRGMGVATAALNVRLSLLAAVIITAAMMWFTGPALHGEGRSETFSPASTAAAKIQRVEDPSSRSPLHLNPNSREPTPASGLLPAAMLRELRLAKDALTAAAAAAFVVPPRVELANVIGAARAAALASTVRQVVGGKDRTPSFPFVTGDGFRAVCTLIYDESTVAAVKSRQFREDDGTAGFGAGDALPVNTSVFVQTHLLDDFIRDVLDVGLLPRTARLVLVTHNSDYSAPWEKDNRRAKAGVVGTYAVQRARLLDSEQIVLWYAQNAVIQHPKLVPIPIGLENRYNKYGAHVGAYAAAAMVGARVPAWQRRAADGTYPAPLASFSVKTNPGERQAALKAHQRNFVSSASRPHAASSGGVLTNPKRGDAALGVQREFLARLAAAPFVLAPKGHGVDTHRLWEALYCSAVPITTPAPLLDSAARGVAFRSLRDAVFITKDSYDDVTPTTLDAWLAAKQQSTKHIQAMALDMNWWTVEVNRHAHTELQHAPSAHV